MAENRRRTRPLPIYLMYSQGGHSAEHSEAAELRPFAALRGRSGRMPERALDREDEPERATPADDGFRSDGTAVHLHELLAQREPQAGTLLLPAGRAVDLAEHLEQLAHILRPDADPAVAHRNPYRVPGHQARFLSRPLRRDRQR